MTNADKGVAASYHARNVVQAERTVKAALAALCLPIRGSYSVSEVRSILGIGKTTFWRLVKNFELDENGRLVRVDCLRTQVLRSNRRVSFLELVEFVQRNDGYLRNHGRQDIVAPTA